MDEGHVPEVPAWLTSTLASDAAGGDGVMEGLAPIRVGQLFAGYASTVTVAEGDNQQLREAATMGPQPGRVLVVAGSPASRRAVMGDLVATYLQNQGFRAVVLDGRVRDVAELRTLSLQVWCRGVSPIASSKQGGGRVGGSVACAGVTVAPGDLVVADDDGVVVWPGTRVAQLLDLALERLRKDQERAAALAAGGELA
jgi:4-hydroxy-4-methyl-2-oxoglutarate aldolase